MSNKIISIIPARGGSKGIPNKNIKDLKGFPLIAYSIVCSLMSKVDRTIVSTDSEMIATISKKYGAEVIMRPKEISQDHSLDIEFMHHTLSNMNEYPEYIAHLRPTTPYRTPGQINMAINYIEDNPFATSLRSAHAVKETPFKHFTEKNGYLEGVKKLNALDMPNCEEYYNMPRQMFPQMFIPSGSVDIIKTKTLVNDTMHGNKILAFLVPDPGELDVIEDFDYIEWKMEKYGCVLHDILKRGTYEKS